MPRYKVMILGDPAVGKTSLFRKIVASETVARAKPAIRLEVCEIIRNIDGNEIIIELYDLPGRELTSPARSKFYKGTHGAFVVFDITRPETFRHTPFWIEELMNYSGHNKVPIILVGNKIDIRENSSRVLNPIDAQQFIFRLNRTTLRDGIENRYMEVSAKEGKGLSTLVDTMIKLIMKSKQKKLG